MAENLYFCGPLAVTAHSDNAALGAKVAENLGLFNIPWPDPHPAVQIILRAEAAPAIPAPKGSYLVCRRMTVDAVPGGLEAACDSGAAGRYDEASQAWELTIPQPEERYLVDVEDLLGLALTTGWRRLGWVPMHAGAAMWGEACALFCAPSGGGKSTLLAALLHRGWQALGDDKLLLGVKPGQAPWLAALLNNFNLHPKTSTWFPEVGTLEGLPAYSDWTPKRRLDIGGVWPGQTGLGARPTHLVQLCFNPERRGFRLASLERSEVLATLLRQTVIPQERRTARQIMTTLASTAASLTGLALEIGWDAYQDPDGLARLEDALGRER